MQLGAVERVLDQPWRMAMWPWARCRVSAHPVHTHPSFLTCKITDRVTQLQMLLPALRGAGPIPQDLHVDLAVFTQIALTHHSDLEILNLGCHQNNPEVLLNLSHVKHL